MLSGICERAVIIINKSISRKSVMIIMILVIHVDGLFSDGERINIIIIHQSFRAQRLAPLSQFVAIRAILSEVHMLSLSLNRS